MRARRVAVAACGVAGAAAAAGLQWRYRYGLNPDTVSYLEIARKAAAGDWRHAVNAYWSPLFPALLAPIVRAVGATPLRVLPAAHALEAATIAAVLWAASALPGMSWPLAGVALFGATALIAPQFIGADLLVMALALWTVGRIAGELDRPLEPRRHVVTGGLGGAAFMAKAFFFPYFLLLLVAAWRISPRTGANGRRAIAYICGFAAIAALWIVPLSIVKGRFTLGDAGSSNLIAHSLVRDVDVDAGMVGPFVRRHELAFPTSLPEHYEPIARFRGPWHIDAAHLARLLALNVTATMMGYDPSDFPMYFPLALLVVWGAAIAGARGAASPPLSRDARFLLAAGALGFGLFLCVHVQSRYLAPFVVMIAAGLAGAAGGLDGSARNSVASIATAIGLVCWLFPAVMLANTVRRSRAPVPDPRSYQLAADWLGANGTRYAVVGPTYDLGFPAWMSRTSLVASVDASGLTETDCAAVTGALAELRIDAVLSRQRSIGCGEWQEVAGTPWSSWKP